MERMLTAMQIRPKKIITFRFGFQLLPTKTYRAKLSSDGRFYKITRGESGTLVTSKRSCTVEGKK
jgi:hypothetical protein